VRNKDGKYLYNFSYADLSAVLASTRAALSANGLTLFHGLSGRSGKMTLRTYLGHSSGAYLECMAELRSREDETIQQFGSIVTYMRRYTVLCLLGIFPTDEDDDGAAAEGLQMERQQPKGRSQPTPPRAPHSAPGTVMEFSAPKKDSAAIQSAGAAVTYTRAKEAEERKATENGTTAAPESPAEDRKISGALRTKLGQLFKRLGYTTQTAGAKCLELTGKPAEDVSEADGIKLQGALEAEEAARST
jgi:hypothetical protein